MVCRKAFMLLLFAVPYATQGAGISGARRSSQHVAEPGYRCHFERDGPFGTFSATFDVPRSGAPPRGSVHWKSGRDQSHPTALSADWDLSTSVHFNAADGEATITAPLPKRAERLIYLDLLVSAEPNRKFSNPYSVDASVLDDIGGVVHNKGSNLYFFNARWGDVVDFSRRHSRFYVFAVRDLALNRPVTLARFEIESAPFIRANKHVPTVLRDVQHMIENAPRACSAVNDLPAAPIRPVVGLSTAHP